MSTHELFSFALQYLKLGVVVGVLFLLGQYFIKKHVTHTAVSGKTLFWNFVFVVYFVVLFCATLARSGYEQVVKLQPFSSYMAAWNNASVSEWRNLLINILLFIPLGFLLPLLSAKWKKCWKTYMCGAIIALFIECLQFIFHRGIVEFDDFLNNTLGTAIGYGFNQIVYFLIAGTKNKTKIRRIQLALYQIPFVAVIAIFSIFFISYFQLQLGTLSCRYSELINMSGITVESQCELNTSESEDYAYIGTLLTEDESNFVRTSGLSAKKIRELLQPYRVTIPNEATFTELGNGEYQFAIHMTKEGDYWYDGICTVIPAKDKRVSHLKNNILRFSDVRNISIMSEQQAYEYLQEGKFILPDEIDNIAEITNICVDNITIGYEIDNKGYAQPVYLFHAIINHDTNKSISIKIPAVK